MAGATQDRIEGAGVLRHFTTALVATTVLVALCAYVLWNQRQESIRLSQLTLRNSAMLLAEQTEHSFDQADALLRSVAYRYANSPHMGEPELERLTLELRNDVAIHPLVKRIGVLDSQGINTINTGFSLQGVRRSEASERAYFQRAKAGEKALIFDGPLRPKLAPQWSIVLARRIEDADGKFLGVVFATLPVATLGEALATIDLGRTSLITLRTDQLALVVQTPSVEGASQEIGKHQVPQALEALMREHPRLDQYTYEAQAPSDGVQRLHVQQKLHHYPFWINVGNANPDTAGATQRTAGSLALVVVPVAGFFFWGARRLARERQRLAQGIAERTCELNDLYHLAPCGYHSLDADGTVLQVNDTELTWLGYTREEMVGKDIKDFLTPASIDTFHRNFPQLVATGSLNELELEFVRQDGSVLPVLLSATAVFDAQGRLLRTRSALIDYSRLHQERSTLKRVLAASPMAVRVARLKDNQILFLNRAFCDLVRRPEDGARSMDISSAYVNPAVFNEIRARLKEGQMVFNQLVELALPDQPEVPKVWALASYMTIEYDGEPAALAWLFDVTDLHQARAEAEAANHAKSAFLANMSHEIRTPLNAILGLNHLILRDERDELQRDRLDKVRTASRHLLQVINDILDMSKIESGRMTLEQREFVLDEVIQRSVELTRPKADEKKLELIVDTDHLPQRLLGDPTRLAQMLINLLSNAVKFTATGWVKLRGERISQDETSVIARFEVQDTGPGIAIERQARLFEAFEQGDTSTTRLHGGTGLGLALTRHFANLMGGDCGLHSVPGAGSTFWFTVRLNKAADALEPMRTPSLNNLQALVVDDLAESREAITDRLVALGLRVQSCASGSQALALIEQLARQGQFFDVLVVDWLMNGMDGVETLRRAAQLLGTGMPPSLLVTAYDDPAMWRGSRQVHAGRVLLKPLTGTVLHEALVGLLQREGAELARSSTGSAETRLQAAHAGMEILLAEDNPINQEVAVELLHAVGLVVDTAVDGRTAVDMAEKKPYALILMDMQMPGMDGLQATRLIRGSDRPDTPIIAMTANAFGEDRAACLASGMNDHLAKPVDPETLYATLLRWLPPVPAVVPPAEPATVDAPLAERLQAAGQRPLEERLAHIEGYSLEQGLTSVGGRMDILVRLLRAFSANYRDGDLALQRALQEADWRAAADAAHSVRGACATVGASTAVALAQVLEVELARSARSPASHALATTARQLNDELARMAAVIALEMSR